MMGIMVTKKPAMVMMMKMERTVTMIEMAMTKILERKKFNRIVESTLVEFDAIKVKN